MASMVRANLSYPVPFIKDQVVPHVGRLALLDSGKLNKGDDLRNRIYFGFEIAPIGKSIVNPRIVWTGPKLKLTILESDLFSDGTDEVAFNWEVNPADVIFPPNQFVSRWLDGTELLLKKYIAIEPISIREEYIKRKDRDWSYRFCVGAVDHSTCTIVLEALPVSVKSLWACPSADSIRIGACRIDEWPAQVANATRQDCGKGFVPFLQDERTAMRKREDALLPGSKEIKSKVTGTLSMMGISKALTKEERVNYNPGEKRWPPEYNDIEALDEEDEPPAKRPRTVEDTPSMSPGGDTAAILTNALQGGSGDEGRALQALLRKVGEAGSTPSHRDEEEKEEEVVPRRMPGAGMPFATPASIGFDVSRFMEKLPPGVDRQKIRHMSFADIRTIVEMSAHMGKEEKNEAKLKAATTTRLIEAMEDNRLAKLHIARFYPQSLEDPDKIWDQMPLRVENHVLELCLTHLGCENKVAPLAIMKAGDRTNALRLKYFLRTNLNVQQKAPRMSAHRAEKGDMGLSIEENWAEADKLIQVQDAMFANMRIMWNLFSFDYGPPNLLEAMHNWRWLAFRRDQLFALKSVIDGVMQRFAHLAAQRKPPLSMLQLDQFVTSHLKSLGGRSSLPDDFQMERGYGGAKGDGGAEGDGVGSSEYQGASATVTSYGAPELCGQYNMGRCPRAPEAKLCKIEGGKALHHSCSFKDAMGTICLKSHPKKHHK